MALDTDIILFNLNGPHKFSLLQLYSECKLLANVLVALFSTVMH